MEVSAEEAETMAWVLEDGWFLEDWHGRRQELCSRMELVQLQAALIDVCRKMEKARQEGWQMGQRYDHRQNSICL